MRIGRVSIAGLTKEGVKVIDKAIEKRFEEATSAVAGFDEKEKEQFAMLLKKMLLLLEQH